MLKTSRNERFFDTLLTMKEIYFACSIRGGRDDAETYAAMVNHIKTRAVVLSEIFADGKLTATGSAGPSGDIHAKDLGWVRHADAVIAEVTNPSLGVGYEIGKAEEWGKPVLALFRDDGTRRLSAMIDGSQDTQTVYYREIDEALVAIGAFLDALTEK
jgi:nucleoside 2-deoxyribosyltransferase